MLGHSVLPVGHLHTTTCVCELRHSTESSIKCFTWNTSDKKLEINHITSVENISKMPAKVQRLMHLTSKNKNLTKRDKELSSYVALELNNNNRIEETDIALLSASTEDVHFEHDDLSDLKLLNGKLEIHSNFDFLQVKLNDII